MPDSGAFEERRDPDIAPSAPAGAAPSSRTVPAGPPVAPPADYTISFQPARPGARGRQKRAAVSGVRRTDGVGPAFRPDESQRAAWDRFLGSATGLLPISERSVGDHLEAICRQPWFVVIQYAGDRASITVPYWYPGDEAGRLLTSVYALGQLLETELGLSGRDESTGLGLGDDGFRDAVIMYAARAARAARLGRPFAP